MAAQHKDKTIEASAVVENVLDELKSRHADLGVKDLLQGRIQVYSTVDARVQQIVNQALEHGLLLYEKRHPSASGLIQGSVVVLRNRDASILAETGGRQFYKDRSSSYSRLQPRHEVPAATWVRNETHCLSRRFSARNIQSRYHGSRRTHQRCRWQRSRM